LSESSIPIFLSCLYGSEQFYVLKAE